MDSALFSKSEPANTIDEVLDLIFGEDDGNFIYRGQTKDYGTLIPSHFRNQLNGNLYDFTLAGKSGYSDITGKYMEKFKLILFLISVYGKDIGNYIAQQYLCNSEVIDCSESPEAAAFFATRAYPFTQALREPDAVGVIYRFDRRLFNSADTVPAWLKSRFPSYRIGRRVDGTDEELDYAIYVEREQTNGWKAEDLFWTPRQLQDGSSKTLIDCHIASHASLLTFADIVSEKRGTDPKSRRDLFLNDLAGDDLPLHGLRPRQQCGGFITPRFLWKCKIPDPRVYGRHYAESANLTPSHRQTDWV